MKNFPGVLVFTGKSGGRVWQRGNQDYIVECTHHSNELAQARTIQRAQYLAGRPHLWCKSCERFNVCQYYNVYGDGAADGSPRITIIGGRPPKDYFEEPLGYATKSGRDLADRLSMDREEYEHSTRRVYCHDRPHGKIRNPQLITEKLESIVGCWPQEPVFLVGALAQSAWSSLLDPSEPHNAYLHFCVLKGRGTPYAVIPPASCIEWKMQEVRATMATLTQHARARLKELEIITGAINA